MKRVTLVDDDLILTQHYADALRLQGYAVDVYHSADDALSSSFEECALLVSDLMMPGGASFTGAGGLDGMMTGVQLVEAVRANGFKVPCALLTNLNISAMLEDVQHRVAKIENVVLMKKSEFNPVEFASVADAVISGDMRRRLSPSLYERFMSSILLKPAFFGVGVDLKRLFGMKE